MNMPYEAFMIGKITHSAGKNDQFLTVFLYTLSHINLEILWLG